MLQIFFSLIIIILAIIVIPLLLNYHYKCKFSYDNNYNINIFLSTSLYSFQFERYAEDNYINNKSYINFLGLKKEFIKRKSKEELKKEKDDKKLASKKEKGKEKKKSSKSKKKFIKNIKENFSDFSSFINRENFEHIFSFVIDLLKELKPRGYNLFLAICFSDPYYNGLVLAYYYSIKSTFKLNDLEIEVSWDQPKFEVDSELMGELIPLNLLFLTFKFIFSPKSIRLIFSIIKNIKK